jgi:hypothetical protein
MSILINKIIKNNLFINEYNYKNLLSLENLIDEYIKDGHSINTNGINQLIFMDNMESVYVYSLLIKKGYVFKNNLYLINYLFLFTYSVPDSNSSYLSYNKRFLFEIINNDEIKRIMALDKIIIKDNDIDQALKLKGADINMFYSIIKYYLNIDKHKYKLPNLELKLNKYNYNL